MSEPQNEQTGTVQTGTDRIGTDADALLSRLRVIEDQPLEARADAFSHIHDELQSNLESDDPTRARG